MPYYVHPSGEDPENSARVSFSSMVEARAAKQNGETVTFVANANEVSSWRDREMQRFHDGTYIDVPWQDYYHIEAGVTARHFAHMSLKFAGRVAFTKSIEHGMLDRQTVMRPGRYLEEYFSNYTPYDRARWVGIVSSLKSELKLARTPDEIERVYVGGPASCMSHKARDYASCEHPVRVYGDSDLAVAYIGDMDAATGRSVVWPEKQVFARIYGNEAVMDALLRQAGYKPGRCADFEGAKLRCIETDNGGYVMPYLDIADTVGIRRINGMRWFVVGDDDYSARNTDGTAGCRNHCEHCEIEIDDNDCYCEACYEASSLCPDCEDRNWDDNTNGYCDACYEHYHCCGRCDELVHEDNMHYLEGQELDVCESCFADTVTCEVCEYPFLESAYGRATRTQRADNGVANRICEGCRSEGAFLCEECGAAVKGGETCDACAKHATQEQEVIACAS